MGHAPVHTLSPTLKVYSCFAHCKLFHIHAFAHAFTLLRLFLHHPYNHSSQKTLLNWHHCDSILTPQNCSFHPLFSLHCVCAMPAALRQFFHSSEMIKKGRPTFYALLLLNCFVTWYSNQYKKIFNEWNLEFSSSATYWSFKGMNIALGKFIKCKYLNVKSGLWCWTNSRRFGRLC